MPPSTFLPSSREDRRAVVILLLLSAIVFLPGLGSRDLWTPDEPRYAEAAREMTVTGQYLVPHLNGELYSQKPPLFFWALASGIRRLWRRLRGLPPPEPEPEPERDPTIPLVRAYGFQAGLAIGALSAVLFVGPDLWRLT